jgi:hypothetical protein
MRRSRPIRSTQKSARSFTRAVFCRRSGFLSNRRRRCPGKVTWRNQIVPAALALEEYHPVDPAWPSHPLQPARRSVRGQRMAFSPDLAGGRTTCRRASLREPDRLGQDLKVIERDFDRLITAGSRSRAAGMRGMLVEAAWAAARAPGPLCAFFLRVRVAGVSVSPLSPRLGSSRPSSGICCARAKAMRGPDLRRTPESCAIWS